jgi:hypothetical protein
VDSDTRRKQRQALMAELLENKIRRHAQDIHDRRGDGQGSALEDWVRAESEVIENTVLGPLYRKSRDSNSEAEAAAVSFVTSDTSVTEAGA